MRHTLLTVLALSLLWTVGEMSRPARACYWDSDTLAQERRRFPDTLALLTGRFPQHSKAFYAWRIKDRGTRIGQHPDDLALRDDLAVALEKVGRGREAIEVLKGSLVKARDRYETHANLGTFLIHAGRLKAGLKHIKAAIRINPKAHFGREIIQQRLVEYVLARRSQGATLPLWSTPAIAAVAKRLETLEGRANAADGRLKIPLFAAEGFAAFCVDQKIPLADAQKGVLGMMRFGDFRHPVLLEALGDLLLRTRRVRQDAKRLAARAYLRAAAAVAGKPAERLYRAKAVLALVGLRRLSVDAVSRRLAREVARGERARAAMAKREARWIRQGKDVEKLFRRRYRSGAGHRP